MSTAFRCDRCADFLGGLGLPPLPPTHCYGEGDTPGIRGVIGSGNYCPCECRTWPHQPNELWNLAAKENPDAGSHAARIARYQELMIEHGHIVKRQPGQSVSLPCGWPHPSAPDPNSDEFKRANPVLAEVREMVAPGKRIEQVSFSIDWMSFDDNDLDDDLEPHAPPDEGWYVTIEAPDGSGGYLGPDHFGPGLSTVDAALDLCRKWAEDRGYTFSRPSVDVTVGRFV